MDEHTEIFIALGVASAANCGPCFEHYFVKAEKLGITKEDIQKAVDIAVKVRSAAHMVVKDTIQRVMTQDLTTTENCCSDDSTCCDQRSSVGKDNAVEERVKTN